jgi:hypothetical protein
MVYHEEDSKVSNSLLTETNDVHIALLPLFNPPYNKRFKAYSNLNIIMNTKSYVSKNLNSKKINDKFWVGYNCKYVSYEFFILNNVDF